MCLVLVLCGVVSAATLINVDLQGGGSPTQVGPAVLGVAGDIWNATSTGFAGLRDSKGNVTNVAFSNPTRTSTYNQGLTQAHSTIINLMRDYVYGSSNATMTFSGLVSGDTYKLICFSLEYNAPGNCAEFTINGVRKVVTGSSGTIPYPLVEGQHYVVFEGQVPVNGQISILVEPSVVNGFQLQVADRGMAHTPVPANGSSQVDTTTVSALSWYSPEQNANGVFVDDPNIVSMKYDVYTRSFNPITKVEAENYTAMYGVQKENTSDTGGGQNIGYIDNGDWTEYAIDIPMPGSYAMTFRVARSSTGTSTINMTLDGSAIGSVTVPSTGGWQTWTTVNLAVNFPVAGAQTLRLTFGGGFNMNWFTYQAEPTTIGEFQLVDPNTATQSYSVSLIDGKAYDWKVDTRITWDSTLITGSLTSVVPGRTWQFTTKSLYTVPSVTFNNVATILSLVPVNLSASVINNSKPITSVQFTLQTQDALYPTGAAAILTDMTVDKQTPTATLTTDKTGNYKVKLVVSDGIINVEKVMEVVVYPDADACAAMKAAGWTANYYDRNSSCVVNLSDFVPLAQAWLNNTGLLAQQTYTSTVFYFPKDIWDARIEAESVIAPDPNWISDYPITDGIGIRVNADAAAMGGQTVLGYTGTGSYAQYTINIPAAGTYDLHLNSSAITAGGGLDFGTADSQALYGSVTNLPGTGWSNYFYTVHPGALTFTSAGPTIVRITWTGTTAARNLDWFALIKQ
jgi:hypothetical protein